MKTTYTSRIAKRTNFSQLLVLWKGAGLKLSDRLTEKQEFLSMLKLNPSLCFVLLCQGKVIGSAFGIFNGRRAWIYHLAIHPAWQKKGIGTKLLTTVENALVKTGGIKIRLWVNYSNLRVIPFYEKHGYQVMNDALMLAKNVVKGGEAT